MDLLKPSYATGYAKNASQSAHPNLWDGLVGAWMPSLGVTGETLRDVVGKSNLESKNTTDHIQFEISNKKTVCNLEVYAYAEGGDLSKKFQGGYSISINLWKRITGRRIPFAQWGAAGTGYASWLLEVNASDQFKFYNFNGGASSSITAPAMSLQEWKNVTVTWDGSTTGTNAHIYYDGIVVASGTMSIIPQVSTQYPIQYGRANRSNEIWSGKIGDTLAYNRALSPTEIKQLYVDSLAPFRTKKRTVVRVPAAIPAATVVGSIKKPTTIIKPSYQAGYARNASESENPQLWDGLVGAWMPSLGVTGNVLRDAINRHYPATLNNNTSWVTSNRGIGIELDGVGDTVTLGSLNETKGVSQLSVMVLAKQTVDNNEYSSYIHDEASVSRRWALSSPASAFGGNTNVLALMGNASNTFGYTSSGNATFGEWNHVGFVFDGNGAGNAERLKIFINGYEESVSYYGTIPALTHNLASTAYLGRYNGQQELPGIFHSVLIWNRAITAGEIKHLYVDSLAPFRRKQRVSVAVPAGIQFKPYWAKQSTQISGLLT